MKNLTLLLLPVIFLAGCSKPDAEEIVQKSIAYYGMQKLENAVVEFDFRNYHFKVKQEKSKFRYERFFTDSVGNVHDVLTNEGFYREVNGKRTILEKKLEDRYTEAVNSVVYFVYLPLKLNDKAVSKKRLENVTINGNEFFKLEVSFEADGGGKDHDDIYYYWFDTDDYSMDHFAYSTGGNRFRKATKLHEVNGVRFQDYINYEHPVNDTITPLIKYDSLYQDKKLSELSRIEMKNFRLKTLE